MKRLIFLLIPIMLILTASTVSAQEAAVSVNVENGTLTAVITTDFAFYAASMELIYDNTALEFAGSKFDELNAGSALINPQYKNDTIKISIISLSEIESGSLCEIKFNIKKNARGNTEIRFGETFFYDGNDSEIITDNIASVASITSSYSSFDDYYEEEDEEPAQKATDTVPEEADVKTHKFTDVTHDAWYYKAVMFVCEKNIANGISETEFAPTSNVTRGQFITMLCRAYGIPQMTGDNFADSGNTWYTPYLAAAKQLGISNGVGNNCFAPEREITREEMVTMLFNYLKSIGEVNEAVNKLPFADSTAVSAWAKPAVSFASTKGYVKGKLNNMFDPQGTATRAELAQIFCNIFSE